MKRGVGRSLATFRPRTGPAITHGFFSDAVDFSSEVWFAPLTRRLVDLEKRSVVWLLSGHRSSSTRSLRDCAIAFPSVYFSSSAEVRFASHKPTSRESDQSGRVIRHITPSGRQSKETIPFRSATSSSIILLPKPALLGGSTLGPPVSAQINCSSRSASAHVMSTRPWLED